MPYYVFREEDLDKALTHYQRRLIQRGVTPDNADKVSAVVRHFLHSNVAKEVGLRKVREEVA